MHVLFIGLGGVGQRHLRNFKSELGDALRVSAYRVRRESAVLSDQLQIIAGKSLEEEYGIEVHHDLDAALAQKPDICVVANPTSLHVPVALKAAEAGCDLFVEKPLSADLSGLDELSAVVQRKQLVAQVTYQLRFHPGVQALLTALSQGVAGRIFGARVEVAEYLPGFHPYEDYRRMYASRKDQGGGVILTQTHELDLIAAAFGMPARVTCVGGHLSDLEIDVEDSATSLMQFDRPGSPSWALSLHQDYLGRPPRRSFSVWGSDSKLDLDLRAGTLHRTDPNGEVVCLVDAANQPRNQLFLDELRHFLECVQTRATPVVDLKLGRRSLDLGLALAESMHSGVTVHLNRRERAA